MIKVRTRLFELEKDRSMSELATLLGLSISETYRIKQGKRGVSGRVMYEAIKAFPQYSFKQLFYIEL